MTQTAIAEKLKIDQSHYSGIERGRWGCSPALAEKLAKIFKRQGLREEHILYPHRYPTFKPEVAGR